MRKTAVIHQAYFLPWLGYFNKLIYSNEFVVLDNVQYNIRYYHNRTNIKSMHGKKIWVTLAVGASNYKVLGNEVRVIGEKTLTDAFATIRHSYARTKYYQKLWPRIQDAIVQGYPSLLNININAIRIILSILNATSVKISLASEFGTFKDPTERLIMLCKKTGCERLILGQGGSAEYHNLSHINNNGIEYTVQRFYSNHPKYPQVFGDFVSHLSTIDALFNMGPEETYSLLLNAWSPEWNNDEV